MSEVAGNRRAWTALPGMIPAPVLALVLVTVFWGATFSVIRGAVAIADPFGFTGLRFGLAAIAVALVSRPRFSRLTRVELVGGVLIGADLFLGYALQADGLRSVASAQSAFLTALYVPMTPLLDFALFRRVPSRLTVFAALLAFGGLVLISGGAALSLRFTSGEWLTLVAALATAFEVVLIGHFAGGVDPRRIAFVQLVTVAVISWTVAAARGHLSGYGATPVLAGGIALGLGTSLAQIAQNWGQRRVPPNRAVLIYTLEPVWAAIFGAALGEAFTSAQLAGGALIVGSIVTSQWRKNA